MIDLEYYYMRFRDYLSDLTDLRYGGYFGGFQKTRYGHLGAHDTMSSHYFVLSRLFGKFPVKESDVLVDVGCGKGRVINWWLRKGCRHRIIGIELDEVPHLEYLSILRLAGRHGGFRCSGQLL